MRTGIHEIRDIHRKQLDTEQKYLEPSSLTPPPPPESHRRLSRESARSPESPTSPLSPLSPTARLYASAFSLKEPKGKESDDTVLEDFFGSDNMSRLKLWQSTESSSKDLGIGERSQSNDRLISAGLPPLPKRKRSPKVHPISVSPRTSRVHASTPDMSLHRRGNQPVNNVCSEMHKLRMKLRETANQTVAEIEERFSPKFNRLTLGPAVDLPPSHASGSNASHSHQGSLDSYPSHSTPVTQVSLPANHGRQHSLPLSVVSQVQSHSPTTAVGAHSPQTSHHGHSNSMSPPSRSPTPPHQHGRQSSQGNVSGLITTATRYHQNQPQEALRSTSSHILPQQHSTGYHRKSGSVEGPRKAQPPPVSRQYSPGNQSGVVRAGAAVSPSEQGYLYGGGRPNYSQQQIGGSYGSRVYSSNPNLLNGGGQESSTHYSTAVIKKRRSSGNKSSDGHTSSDSTPVSHTHEYDQLQPTAYMKYQPQSKRPQGQTQVHPGYSETHQPNSHHHQRGVPPSSSEMNFQQAPGTIKPYMSTGELRANMKPFQYVPFAENRKPAALSHSHIRQGHAESTWL